MKQKVLLLAEVCNPEWPSLPSFTYSLANSVSKHVDATLVTHIRNKKSIDKQANNFKEVIYINNEVVAKPLYILSKLLNKLKIGGWMTNMATKYPSYVLFEWLAYRKLRKRLHSGEFALINRLSPVSPTIPSPIASWVDIPFILGPLNGALPWPKRHDYAAKREREWISYVRNAYKFLPYYKKTFTKSQKILAAFEHVKKDVPTSEHHKILKFNELGVDVEFYKPNLAAKSPDSNKCIFLFVGRLVPYKGAHILIEAFALNNNLSQNHELWIVGDGPEKEALTALINSKRLNDSVKMLGWKTQQEVVTLMQASDVFAFPTIREVGGNVIVEAMSAGLPCIVPSYGGPDELVVEERGVKVSLNSESELLKEFANAMQVYANDPLLREKHGSQARDYVIETLDWHSKAKRLIEIYETVD